MQRGKVYLVGCSLEFNPTDLADFGGNFDVETLLGVQTLDRMISQSANSASNVYPQCRRRYHLELGG